MKIKKLIARYNEVSNNFVGKISSLSKIKYFLDFIGAYIVHGISFNDYFIYRFYTLNRRGRKEYITLRRTRKIQHFCNDNNALQVFRDKIKFNHEYSELLGRKWLDVSASNQVDFDRFVSENVGDRIFIKDVNGLCGIGVECIETAKVDPLQLYKKLTSDNNARYLLEEPLKQSGPISEFHPWSVNTIRITTVLDGDGENVNIMGAVLRMGTNQDYRDNLSAKGICAHIDIKTGIIFMPAFDKYNNSYIVHPDTGKQIVGFKIPDWEECKNFICRVAKRSPKVRYVGWDIVAKGDGTFLLIEGNDDGGYSLQQRNYKGQWDKYRKVLNI
ncbi:MAG: hypothetical protein K2G67_00085 [Muribaculaceae bacterium]|nr:hypothetical protein [Muribaculaceae bacterium]